MCFSAGRQIVGYIVKPSGEWELIGTRSPQDAQVSLIPGGSINGMWGVGPIKAP